MAQATATPGSGSLDDSRRLRRDIGFLGLTFVALGSIIGSGWLLGALSAAQAAGPASIISWIMAGVFLTLLALVHAELGAAYPVSGGTARFPHIAFGSLAGFTAGWMAWVQAVTIAPIEVEAALSYTNNKWHGLIHTNGTLTPRGLLISTALMAVFTVVNLIGVKLLSDTNTVTVMWKLAIPILTIVVLLILRFHSSNFTAGGGFAPHGVHGIFLALPAGVVFALQGFEQAIQVGGEARNPQRDLPRAILTAMAIGVVVYLLLEIAFIGSINPANVLHGWDNPIAKGDFGPYATLASAAGAGWLAVLLYIDAFISPSGTGLLYVGTASRVTYGLGRNGQLPKILSAVSNRGVPWGSLILAFVIGEISFLPFPSWQSLVGLVTSATAIMYGFAPVTLGALRRRDPNRDRPFVLPAAGLLSPASFVAASFIIYWSGWTADWKLSAAIVVGLGIFAVQYALTTPSERPIVDWKASSWVWPWLIGLLIIGKLGRYGGNNTIPFWWDLVILGVFAVIVYEVGSRLGMSTENVHKVTEQAEQEAAIEEKELSVG